MHIEEVRTYCLSKDDAEECFPFGEKTLVFKVCGKIFLLAALDSHPLQFNVKCDPDVAAELREQYSSIIPGYHMNKKYWNTVIIDESLSRELLIKMIDDSYCLVKPKPGKRKA
ncbi:MAG: hypothetical protein JWQ96_1158 [Segetibacter sp.]|nr:hypothetical protein [Segetibacter sp.]